MAVAPIWITGQQLLPLHLLGHSAAVLVTHKLRAISSMLTPLSESKDTNGMPHLPGVPGGGDGCPRCCASPDHSGFAVMTSIARVCRIREPSRFRADQVRPSEAFWPQTVITPVGEMRRLTPTWFGGGLLGSVEGSAVPVAAHGCSRSTNVGVQRSGSRGGAR